MATALARVADAGATVPPRVAGVARPRSGGVERTRRAVLGPRRNIDSGARRRSIALLGAALALLSVMIAGAILLARPGHVEVPRLVGLRRSAVIASARRLGLRPQFDNRYAEVSAGTAIGQRPGSGARVPRGSVVRVVLSEGPRPVEVPRVAGMGDASARLVLRSLGLAVRVTYVAAPGQAPGTVVGQEPGGGRYVAAHSTIALALAEMPQWRPVTTLTGSSDMRSAPFRIRGSQWRVVYGMSYVGTCSLIFFCDGPTAHVTVPGGGDATDFDLSDGSGQTQVFHSGRGVYQLGVSTGSDTARWSLLVEDYF
jgi:beta-lactam-binding protein with PASTA domain